VIDPIRCKILTIVGSFSLDLLVVEPGNQNSILGEQGYLGISRSELSIPEALPPKND